MRSHITELLADIRFSSNSITQDSIRFGTVSAKRADCSHLGYVLVRQFDGKTKAKPEVGYSALAFKSQCFK